MRLLALSSVLLAACASTPNASPPATEGLDITLHTNTELAGSFLRDGTLVTFQASEVSSQVIFQKYTFTDLVLSSTTDHSAGVGKIDSNGVMVTEAHRATLEALNHALEDIMPPSEKRVLVEDVAYRLSGYFATAQTNEIVPSFAFKSQRSWTYIGSCSCGNQYIGCTSGAGCYYRQVGRGNGCTGGSGNGCKARCGVGCSSDLSGAYTWDCGRHDYGLDSWTAASDDFSFAGNNC